MRRLKTGRRPPIYPKTPGHLPCSSLTHPLPLSSRPPSVSFGGFGLKGMAEYDDMTLGELLEDIVLHAFAGVSKFDGKASQERIEALKKVYGMDYDAHATYRFLEARSGG